jgi:hypothetical protein
MQFPIGATARRNATHDLPAGSSVTGGVASASVVA